MQKIRKAAFKSLGILTILLYLPACLIYIISASNWWVMGILGIGFPYLWLALCIFFIVSLWQNWRVPFFIFTLLLCGWPIMRNVLALNKPRGFEVTKKPGSLRVMQLNCQGFQGEYKGFHHLLEERGKAVAFLRQYQPDIICLQEFSTSAGPEFYSNIALLKDTLGYRYYTFRPYYHYERPWASNWIGNAIFSKYPIADSGSLVYPGKKFPEDILWAGIAYNGRNVRVAATHLESFHLTHVRDNEPVAEHYWEDSLVIFQGSYLQKLRYFQPYHVQQAAFLRSFLDTCQGPLILGGDLNSVPSSYVYNKIRGPLRDAFLDKGTGFGRSFHSWQPALRIDYLFYNHQLRLLQHGLFRITFSDHDAEMIDVEYR